MAKKKEKYSADQEPFNRFCPICGASVRAGAPLHRCDEKLLEQIEIKRKRDEETIEEQGVESEPDPLEDICLLDPEKYYYDDDDGEEEA
jgi:hypothetical protein